jgi:hypothetical protein
MVDTVHPKDESSDSYFDRLDAAFSTLSATPRQPPPVAPSDVGSTQSSVIADTFAALLALEEGAPGARPVRLVSTDSEPPVTDAFVEEVTQRVLQRLAPEVVRDVVAEIVSEVSERLVKEEIARIRKAPNV